MAHGFLQSFDKRLDVHSAGTVPGPEVNPKAIEVMAEAGVDISGNTPKSVERYLRDPWDYVVTVCDDANETCPFFPGKVSHRLHMGFEDPSKVVGSAEFINSEFRRVRDLIKAEFYNLYTSQIKPQL
jgi:arsenate reductase (thioredoxin)